MSTVIELDDLRDGYLRVVDAVLCEGAEVSPRRIRTLELGQTTLVIKDPSKVVPVGVGRKLNLAIGAAESAQLVGGVSDASQMVSITKNFAQFVEGGRFRGAYGPRTHAQFPRVVDLISRDPDTRQAGVVIWRPDDLASPSKDVPCTMMMNFFLRGGRLNMHVTMRSNDVFWGLPYDAWMFANVQHAVAYALGVEVGTYYHTAFSLHVYIDRDRDKIEALHPFEIPLILPPTLVFDLDLERDGSPADRWNCVTSAARAVMGVEESNLDAGKPSWHRSILLPYKSQGRMCPSCRYVLPISDFLSRGLEPQGPGEHYGTCYSCREGCRGGETL